jgi:hypothetical protein
LNSCETLTCGEEHWLRALENRVLKKVFGLSMKTGEEDVENYTMGFMIYICPQK